MKQTTLTLGFCLVLLASSSVLAQQQSPQPWSEPSKLFGDAAKVQDGIFKASYPRHDLNVHIGRTKVVPEAGLTSWIGMRQEGSDVVADGDLVVLPSELDAVLKELTSRNIEVTGIHNHLAGEMPHVLYVHFFARGGMVEVSEALHGAVAKTGAIHRTKSSDKTRFDVAAIEQIMKAKGKPNGAALGFSFPRPHPIAMHGATLPPPMGMATAINFQDSPKGVAATGDFVVEENLVTPLVKSLTQSGVTVTAIHNHLLDDQPKMVFVHFWAEGAAKDVARALREAVDTTGKP